MMASMTAFVSGRTRKAVACPWYAGVKANWLLKIWRVSAARGEAGSEMTPLRASCGSFVVEPGDTVTVIKVGVAGSGGVATVVAISVSVHSARREDWGPMYRGLMSLDARAVRGAARGQTRARGAPALESRCALPGGGVTAARAAKCASLLLAFPQECMAAAMSVMPSHMSHAHRAAGLFACSLGVTCAGRVNIGWMVSACRLFS